MKRSLLISASLHLVVAMLMLFGVPFLPKREIIQEPIAIEFVSLPIKTAEERGGEKVPQIPPSAPKEETKKASPVKEPVMEEVVEEIKPAAKTPDKKTAPAKTEEKGTIEQARSSVAEMLKGLKPSTSATPPKVTPQDLLEARNKRLISISSGRAGSIAGTGEGGRGGMNEGEIDMLRAQLTSCWNFPVGAKNPEELVVDVRVEMNPDRTVKSTEVIYVNTTRMDTFYRSAAEAARRAVLRCQPLQVPGDKYEVWSTIVIRFDPKELL